MVDDVFAVAIMAALTLVVVEDVEVSVGFGVAVIGY